MIDKHGCVGRGVQERPELLLSLPTLGDVVDDGMQEHPAMDDNPTTVKIYIADLTVCQAMIMAMTVVLPAPVASFSAKRSRPGLASLLALSR